MTTRRSAGEHRTTKPIIAGLAAALALCSVGHAQPGGDPQAAQEPPARAERPFLPEPNVDLEELLTRVAASTDKEFLIDSRARARVYVGGTSLDDPTYPELLSILRANGLAAVEVEGRVNVLPAAEARQIPGRLVQRDDPDVPDDEWVTRVISIRGEGAARMVPILRPLLPQEAHLAAIVQDGESSSKLIIVDRYANVRRLTELVNVLME